MCSASRRKIQNPLKDRARIILFSRRLQKSLAQSLLLIFIKTMTHQFTAHFYRFFNIKETKMPLIWGKISIELFLNYLLYA
jgi:hypothetical protein